MPEEQNELSRWWNRRFNSFATRVLHWNQLGDSNVDVKCGSNGKPQGLDSVFAYRTNPKSSQQIVIAEAKYRAEMKDAPRSDIQDWLLTLLEKIESIPHCGDFQQKFSPARNVSIGLRQLLQKFIEARALARPTAVVGG